ncbi:MAG: alpha-2-macroglobulin family protein, partial [Myxococcota bacterium]
LGPGEEVELPVSVFALDDEVRDVTLRVEAGDGLSVLGEASRDLSFTSVGDQTTSLRLAVGYELGPKRVRVIAVSGDERAEQEIEIEVRHPGRPEMRILAGTVEPGAAWSPEVALAGIAGSNEISLEVSRMVPMDLTRHLRYLIGYPHGCLEQTMSKVFPQLHLAKLLNLDQARQAEISRNIRAGVNKLGGFQTAAGGFSYWASQSEAHDWTTSYVGHFLLEAKEAGHPVPAGLLQRWEAYQRRVAQAFVPGELAASDLSQAYRLYTLALAGHAEMGAMNRLREWQKLTTPARWRLAAAYQLAGQNETARRLVDGGELTPTPGEQAEDTFGSSLRDKAMILETAVLMNDGEVVSRLSREIATTLSGDRGFNTHETGFALIAMARAAERFGETGETRAVYEWQGESHEVDDGSPVHVAELTEPSGKPSLTLTNSGSTTVFTRLLMTGLPEVGGETAAAEGLRLSVDYRDLNGKAVEVERLEQGTDLVARVHVSNVSGQSLSEIALTHIVPSGWEIRNERLTSSAASAGGDGAFDHRDFRDDRVHTYFDLRAGESKSFEVRLHSAYPGRFYLPGIGAEAMYDPTVHGRTTGRWVELVRPGLTG